MHFTAPSCSLPGLLSPPLSRAEAGVLLALYALLALAWWGPALPASAHALAQGYADQRTLWGIPCAADVLSNLPFALAGLWGLVRVARLPRHALGEGEGWQRGLLVLFFGGLVCTAVGSSLYHLQPQDSGLLWDRLGMVLPFAGLLGLAAAGRVSLRAGGALAAATLLGGALALLGAWRQQGNLLPWAVVQFGGMAVVLALAALPRRPGTLAVHLGAVIACYGAAKLLELGDHAVLAATGQWVSGHSLKHVVAAFAALPVLWALQPRLKATPCGQNGGQADRPAARQELKQLQQPRIRSHQR